MKCAVHRPKPNGDGQHAHEHVVAGERAGADRELVEREPPRLVVHHDLRAARWCPTSSSGTTARRARARGPGRASRRIAGLGQLGEQRGGAGAVEQVVDLAPAGTWPDADDDEPGAFGREVEHVHVAAVGQLHRDPGAALGEPRRERRRRRASASAEYSRQVRAPAPANATPSGSRRRVRGDDRRQASSRVTPRRAPCTSPCR